MKIKAKFNVGDMIWFIKYSDMQKKFFVDCLTIEEILASYNDYSDNELRIIYLRYDEHAFILGKDSFETKEEAQKECDKRNKGEKR